LFSRGRSRVRGGEIRLFEDDNRLLRFRGEKARLNEKNQQKGKSESKPGGDDERV
jgi:hypothetical protein